MKTILIILIIIASVIFTCYLSAIAHYVIPGHAAGWSLVGALISSGIAIFLMQKVLKKNKGN